MTNRNLGKIYLGKNDLNITYYLNIIYRMYNETQKRAIMNWRSKNKDRYNELSRQAVKRSYEKNKEIKIQKTLGRYYLKKEFEIFRNILIDI